MAFLLSQVLTSMNIATFRLIKNPFHIKELYRNEFESLLNTHFKNTVLFGQRVVSGSNIANMEEFSAHTYISYSNVSNKVRKKLWY